MNPISDGYGLQGRWPAGVVELVQTTEARCRVRYTEAGTFTYICTIHGRAVMSGTVAIQ